MIVFNPNKIRILINEKHNSDRNFRQTLFLKEIDLSATALKNILDGKSAPSINTLISIANYFGKDINYFCDLPEIKISNIKITDGIEYIVKRFEEMAVELAEEKKEKKKYKDRVEQLEGVKKYTLPDVPVSHAAEAQVELKKKQ